MLVGTALAAWGGLAWMVSNLYPTQPRVLESVYVVLFIALSASAGAVHWVLARLLPRLVPRSALGLVGHGVVFGGLALFGLWLQSLRLLSPIHAVLLVGLYLSFELAMLLGRREA